MDSISNNINTLSQKVGKKKINKLLEYLVKFSKDGDLDYVIEVIEFSDRQTATKNNISLMLQVMLLSVKKNLLVSLKMIEEDRGDMVTMAKKIIIYILTNDYLIPPPMITNLFGIHPSLVSRYKLLMMELNENVKTDKVLLDYIELVRTDINEFIILKQKQDGKTN